MLNLRGLPPSLRAFVYCNNADEPIIMLWSSKILFYNNKFLPNICLPSVRILLKLNLL